MKDSIKILGAFGSKTNDTAMTCIQIDDNIVIDAGNILLGLKDDARNIDHIFLTHSHMDHIADIPFLIDIYFDESRDEIEVVTSSISNNGKVKKFVVDYTVRIPSDNYLKIENSFGNVIIGSHKGIVKLDVKFGNIKAKNIINDNNEIDLQFGNATINKYGSGEVELQHSNLDINSVLDLKLDSEFSNTKIKEVVRTITAEVSHGGLDVETIYSKFESIKIEAEFSKINLKIDGSTPYTIQYKGSFTSFSKPSSIEIINRDKDYTSEEIMGKVNGGGSLVNLKLSHSTLSVK